MIIRKDDNMVNSLISKEGKKPADVSLDDVNQLLTDFKRAFDKDMLESGIEKYIEKYCIEDPFDEINDSNTSDAKTIRNLSRKDANSKWDLIDLKTFSPKYLAALDKVLERQAEEDAGISESNSELPEWNAVDEEWKDKMKNYMENECRVDITWPEGFYDTIRRSYAIQGLRKKHPWIALSKTTTKTVSDRFRKGRRKESLRTTLLQGKTDTIKEVMPEPPPWHEMEKMRQKCLNWLTQNEKSTEIEKSK